MKFSILPVALLAAFAATGAVAQDSSSASSSESTSSSASSSVSSSSAAPTSMSSSSSSGSSGGSGGGAMSVCTPLGGDARNPPAACPYSSTSIPPYDLNSLISYFIYGYTRGPEAKSPDEVASEMAGSVLQYYPTLTTPESVLAESFAVAISATIQAVADGKLTAADLHSPNAAVPANLIQWGVAAAAIVAAGAFAL
ncbi:hypothetical protein PSEUBRA_002448 [Kalmanozyma brasiliensis GHG001]|uniref:Uncharacterized protein n=1 Tax=Kalmanozyma brasiliensis (strain GHG001) TaxID=1365824 RepID=V5ECC1_KALBG|nr:uncharacterized protein PSEUBRA_002448 [Kalmanozyma brasiliensis GHG001]EST08051.1 hypothetical protein PSEUBRA_002448 [Kalmanozyma brasiliensis GHG001]